MRFINIISISNCDYGNSNNNNNNNNVVALLCYGTSKFLQTAIPCNKPDITLRDIKEQVSITDISVPSDRNMANKQAGK
jgi:hypothetical protein